MKDALDINSFNPSIPPRLQDLSHLPSYKANRLQRYYEYANPQRRRPQPLLFVTSGVVALLFIGIGLLPKYMADTEVFDDPCLTDKSDKIVEADFEGGKWVRKSKGSVRVPESLTWRSKRDHSGI